MSGTDIRFKCFNNGKDKGILVTVETLHDLRKHLDRTIQQGAPVQYIQGLRDNIEFFEDSFNKVN